MPSMARKNRIFGSLPVKLPVKKKFDFFHWPIKWPIACYDIIKSLNLKEYCWIIYTKIWFSIQKNDQNDRYDQKNDLNFYQNGRNLNQNGRNLNRNDRNLNQNDRNLNFLSRWLFIYSEKRCSEITVKKGQIL